MTRARDLADSADKDIAGTLTLDGLAVNSGTSNTVATFESTDAGAFVTLTDPTGTSSIAAEGQYMYLDVDKDSVVASSQMRFRVDGSTKLVINDSGNVGIGETTPQGRLHLKKTDTGNSPQNPAGNQLVIENGDSSGSADIQFLSASNGYNHIFFGDAADANIGVLLYDHTNNSMQFQVNASERMRIDSSGNVGIGTTSPDSQLTIGGNVITTLKPTVAISDTTSGGSLTLRGQSPVMYFDCTSGGVGKILTDGQGLEIKDGTLDSQGNVNFKIDSNGNVGFGSSSTDALESRTSQGYMSLRVNNFNINAGTGSYGFIGQNIYQDTAGVYKFIDTGDSSSIHFWGSAMQFHMANGSADATQSGSEKMRIDSSGNVGIGTSSPASLAHINSSADTVLTIQTTNVTADGRINFRNSAGTDAGRIWYNTSGNRMLFYTNSTERMRIDSSGRVGIGETSPSILFQVSGNVDSNYVGSFHNDGNNANRYVLRLAGGSDSGSGTSYLVGLQDGDFNSVGSITHSGGNASFNTSSDYRLKENVVDMTGAIDRVKSLAPKRFNFIRNPDITVDGFIAHEAQVVVPGAVSGTHNEVDDDGNPVYQGIDHSKLVPLLVGALKESIAKIETLETKVAALEAN